jgi:hypothetical protein
VSVRQIGSARVAVELTGAPRQRPLRLVLSNPEPPAAVRFDGARIARTTGLPAENDLAPGWSHDPETGETTIAIPGSVRKVEVDGPVSLLRRGLGGRR